MSKESVKYEKSDVVMVDVVSDVSNFAFASALDNQVVFFESGKPQSVKMYGYEVDNLLKEVEDEMDEWKKSIKWEATQFEKLCVQFAMEGGRTVESLTPDEKRDLSIQNVWNHNSAAKRFYDSVGRSKKPLVSVSVKENLGPNISPAQKQAKEANADLKQMLMDVLQALAKK